MWIVVRQRAGLRLALGTEGNILILRSSFTRGFRDIAVGLHDSGFAEKYAVYGWAGNGYKELDCYSRIVPIADDSRIDRAVIENCR
jgi:hypothetical protein